MELSSEMVKLTGRIIGACLNVHNALGPGFPEEYYQNALAYEFERQKLGFEPQKAVPVFYLDLQVGINYLDFLVEEKVVVEIKTVKEFTGVHQWQIIKYLTATNLDVGLLINFGQEKMQFKRVLPPLAVQQKRRETAGR